MDYLEVDSELVNSARMSPNSLEDLWKARLELMTLYRDKNMIPDWPLPLDNEPNQVFMRDLMGYLMEEIYEAFTVLEDFMGANEWVKLKPEDKLTHLVDFNEEVADGLHFW